MIKRSWVRTPAGVVGEFSSLRLTFCADSRVAAVARKRFPVILKKVQVAGYS